MAGVQPLAPSFDTVGLFARDAVVLGRVAEVLLSAEVRPPEIRRVLMLEQGWEIADAEIRDLRPLAEGCLGRAGLRVESVSLGALVAGDLGADFFAWKKTFSGVQWPEVWSTYGAWLEAVAPELGPKVAGNFANVKKAGRSELAASKEFQAYARACLRASLPADTVLCVPTTSSRCGATWITTAAAQVTSPARCALRRSLVFAAFPKSPCPSRLPPGFP